MEGLFGYNTVFGLMYHIMWIDIRINCPMDYEYNDKWVMLFILSFDVGDEVNLGFWCVM